MKYPISPSLAVEGVVYLPRLCNKIRLFKSGELHSDFHENLGKGMDLWTCQFFKIEYSELRSQVLKGATDEQVLEWAKRVGHRPTQLELDWWNSYMRNRGFRDDLSEKLAFRIKEGGFEDRGIFSFFDYLDADEGR